MDRALYIAMSGAKQNVLGQAAHSNNLANANTTGFRADFTQSRAMGVFGEHFPSRAYAMTERPISDFRQGHMIETGRRMDVAIEGAGWFAVQGPDGKEAYTRSGDLSVDPQGRVLNGRGLQLIGDGGPITVEPYEKIEVSRAGIITIQASGATPAGVAEPIQIKLVNPDYETLEKGKDGLFRFLDPNQPPALADPNITLVNGFVEGSNVNAVNELTSIMQLHRQYEMQVKMMKSVDDNDTAATRVLSSS